MRILYAALLICSLSVSASAQGKGKAKGKDKDKDKHHQTQTQQTQMPADHGRHGGRDRDREHPVFVDRDREIITRYFRNTSNLPPGLAKRGGNLPPGLQRQLERNGTLPPGLQKRIQPFPADLNRQLAPLPVGYRRYVIGEDVIIYNPRTQAIADIIRGVAVLTGR